MQAAVAQVPGLAGRLRAGRRTARIAGTGDLPGFFRTPCGPGWALAGDAGYHRDPLTAQGISDAFRDAQLLSEAIDAGRRRQPLAGALAGYQRQRDEAATAMYELTCQRAALEPPTPQMSRLLAALHGNQHDTDRLSASSPAPSRSRSSSRPATSSASQTLPTRPPDTSPASRSSRPS